MVNPSPTTFPHIRRGGLRVQPASIPPRGPGAPTRVRQRGALLIELLVAMALLAFALIPVAYSIAHERRYARALYQRAVAMEIVDGELEAIAAGHWRAFTNGTQSYPVQAAAAANLPPGRFLLTLDSGRARLEWRPSVRRHGGPVVREATLR